MYNYISLGRSYYLTNHNKHLDSGSLLFFETLSVAIGVHQTIYRGHNKPNSVWWERKLWYIHYMNGLLLLMFKQEHWPCIPPFSWGHSLGETILRLFLLMHETMNVIQWKLSYFQFSLTSYKHTLIHLEYMNQYLVWPVANTHLYIWSIWTNMNVLYPTTVRTMETPYTLQTNKYNCK